MRLTYWIQGLAALPPLLGAGLAGAAETRLDPLAVEAPGIEETATSDLARLGWEMEVVTREQIERAGPSADVTRVLQRYVPGLYVAPKTGPFDYATYSLRGSRSADILILLDGVRLNNRLYGGLYIDTISTAAIERIEVVKGAQGLIFGTEAVAGVINIVTRRVTGDDPEGAISAGLATDGARHLDGRAGNRFPNALGALDLMVFGSHDQSNGYIPYRSQDIEATVSDRRRSYRVANLGFRATQHLGDTARADLFYQYAAGKLDFAKPYANRDVFNDRTQHIATASFEHAPSAAFDYALRAHLNVWDTDYTRIHNLDGGGTTTVNDGDYWGFKDYGLKAQGRWRFAGQELLFGADSQFYRGADDVLVIGRQTGEAYGLFTQFRPHLDALPETDLSIGTRYNWTADGAEALVWSASIRQGFGPAFIRALAGTSFRLPTAEQLYANDDCCARGNPGLDPETSREVELGGGVEFDLGRDARLTLEATAFRREIDDMIDGSGDRFVNISEGVLSEGVELEAGLDFARGWSTGAGVTFVSTERRDTGLQLDNIPTRHGFVRIGYETPDDMRGFAPGDSWGADLYARHVGNVRARGVDYGDYVVFDASGFYAFGPNGAHRLTLTVENLLDHDYATGRAGTGTPGRYVDQLGRPLTAELRYGYSF